MAEQFGAQEAPTPQDQTQPPAQPSEGVQDEIRTLYVLGLPNDVRYREVYNFFRFLPEFESISLNIRGRSPAAWVIFSSNRAAMDAVRTTNMMNFDLDDTSLTLRVELAKHNSHAKKRTRQDVEYERDQQKRFRGSASPAPQALQGGRAYDPYAQPQMGAPQAGNGFGPPQQGGGFQGGFPQQSYPPVQGGFAGAGGPPGASWNPDQSVLTHIRQFISYHGHTPLPLPPGGNQPCSTLFIAGISRETSQDELREAFHGCLRLRYTPPREKGGAIAFADFDSIDTAIAVREMLHGFHFKDDDFGRGIKIEYAKSPMGAAAAGGPGGPGAPKRA